jgi:glycine cleavage system transcriptional repressor
MVNYRLKPLAKFTSQIGASAQILKERDVTMRVNHQHYLVVTVLGKNHVTTLEVFTKISKQCGCNILESKLMSLGEECAMVFYLEGSWSTVAKMEAALPNIAHQHGFAIQSKRTLPSQHAPALPYLVQVTAHDRSGILNELAWFFVQQGIKVDKMECETYTAKNNTQMANVALTIHIPAKQHIATVREHFMIYCEDRNLDAVIEPYKCA